MLTVPQAARRSGRNPETIRRWIREGKLRSTTVGTQHVIDEADLESTLSDDDDLLPMPSTWRETSTGEPMPNVVRAVRMSRAAH
jgi:excisionase family DNA binding protein